VGRQRSEQVVGLDELDAGLLADLLGGQLAELGMRVQAGADRGAADGQLAGPRIGVTDAVEREVDLGNPATDHLAEGHRGGVLQVRAAHHHDIDELVSLGGQGVTQLRDIGVELLVDLGDHGDVHGGREGVVRALAAVHMVVGVNRLLGAHLAARDLDRAVADDLVGVHVRLGARAGLEDHQREVLVELALDDLVGGLHDQVGDIRRQLAQIRVGLSSSLLEYAESLDHRPAPDESRASDVEVLQAPLGLSAPVPVSGHFNCAHGIGFDA